MTTGLSVSIYLIFSRRFLLDKDHLLLSSLLVAPFILSLILYGLFYFFPSKPGYFYVICQSLFVSLLFFSHKKYISNLFVDFRFLAGKLKQITFSATAKILLILFSFIFLLCTLRIFCWPINWDDQIYYIEQSYAIGQSRSVKDYFDWGEFDNGIIKFSYNPAIRPGLALIYSFTSLFSDDLDAVVAFSQVMTFYFLIISLGVFALITKHINKNKFPESSLVAFLLVFSSYQYISLTVMGFKELPILCIVLLILDFVASKRFSPRYSSFLYLGVLTGAMSFINLEGSLFSCIVALIIFFLTKTDFRKKVELFFCSLAVLTLVSGFEFPYFFTWTITGGAKSINIIEQIKNIFTHTSNQLTNGGVYRISEFASYGIKNNVDVLVKGKLQGFFQPEFYGLVFWAFLLILFSRFRQVFNNRLMKLILVFIGLYYLIFIDIFGLNSHQYAYVMTVSHKYTALIIPFIAIIVGSQWEWIKDKLRFISLKVFTLIMLLLVLVSTLYIGKHLIDIFHLLSKVVPVSNPTSYYLDKLAMINSVILIVAFIGLVVSLLVTVFLGQKAVRYWNNLGIGSVMVIAFVFIMPSLIFFETNFGLVDTLKYSTASKETKLSKIKGWEDRYYMINYLNSLPKKSKILFVDSPYELMAIHLDIPSRDITFLVDSSSHRVSAQDINAVIVNSRINYALLPSICSVPSNLLLLKATNSFSLYDTKFAK